MTLPTVASLLRPELRGRTPYGAPQLDVAVRLNTNENPFPPSPDVIAALRDAVVESGAALNRYPDREALGLRTALGAYLGGVAPERMWVGNGSNEVLLHLCMAFAGPGRTALGFDPSYSMHRLIAESVGTRWLSAPRGEDFELDRDDAVRAVRELAPDVVFLCSPNNPTGGALAPSLVAAVCDAAPGLVVVDEAYAEFSHHPSLLPVLDGRAHVVLTRTMSKAFALAGARVGYLTADAAVIDALRLVRLPYHVSSLTQAAALVALDAADELLGAVALLRSERDRVRDALLEMGLVVARSDANFLLVGRFPDASATWQALLDRGVLIRDVGIAHRLRASIGTPAENDALLAALVDIHPRVDVHAQEGTS